MDSSPAAHVLTKESYFTILEWNDFSKEDRNAWFISQEEKQDQESFKMRWKGTPRDENCRKDSIKKKLQECRNTRSTIIFELKSWKAPNWSRKVYKETASLVLSATSRGEFVPPLLLELYQFNPITINNSLLSR